MEKNTGKVREFCQPKKVGTLGVSGAGGVSGPGGVCSGGCLLRGVSGPGGRLLPGGGWVVPGGDLPGTATAAGGTHPNGMHSCYVISITRTITNPSPREIVDADRST